MPWVKHVFFLWVQRKVVLFLTIQPGFFRICEQKAAIWLSILISVFQRQRWERIIGMLVQHPYTNDPKWCCCHITSSISADRSVNRQKSPTPLPKIRAKLLNRGNKLLCRFTKSCAQTFSGGRLSSLHPATTLAWT